MTRDTPGLHDDRETGHDADVYGALWTAAPFPRLPLDAPNELKKLTIDIDDPKRVYAIHRASRRHHFQILVERYIIQLRYGCQSKTCTTSTCFSCRKRLAGGAPVRRYNATSARTLAMYLGSQDNPERGLCHNPSAEIPIAPMSKTLIQSGKNAVNSGSESVSNGHAVLSKGQNEVVDAPSTETAKHVTQASPFEVKDSEQRKPNTESIQQNSKSERGSVVDVLEEHTTTDHRSFIQNVVETVAFKMVEWLTPRNLEIMSRSEEYKTIQSERGTADPDSPPATVLKAKRRGEERKSVSSAPASLIEPNSRDHKPPPNSLKRQSDSKSSAPTTEAKSNGLIDPRSSSNPAATHTSPPSVRKRTDPIDPPNPKGILNLSPRTENPLDIRPLSRDELPSKAKRKVSRQSVITSPKLHPSEMNPIHEVKTQPDRDFVDMKPSIHRVKMDKGNGPVDSEKDRKAELTPKRVSRAPTPIPGKDVTTPQSLSHLSIEVIDLMCDILQVDDTDEKHFLHPQRIYEGLKRRRSNGVVLKRRPSAETRSGYPSSLKNQWRSFIEQCFFDSLCKPSSLLRSFSNEEMRLFDTQTIWYLMLRMTRVAPSLVFDSLWNVAGSLFLPPEKLESISDWAKESQPPNTVSNRPVSNSDAAQILYISLHALVAAVPLVSEPRQQANMSRLRSYGLTILPRDWSPEQAELCLQWEDAFSNELAMRLARRIFAVIPTRRRYAELLELQRDVRSDETNEPDILDTVLASLKFLDLETPPILDFPDSERDLHEKRVPILILDWARTVMLQDWEGTAEVPIDGPFGGALAMMAAIYKNRKSLLLGDIHFRTEYFAERLDPVDMPLEWLNFTPNRRTVHLLEHPYLFHPATLVTYFRAINYSRMNQAYETAKAANSLMRSTISETNLMTDQERRQKLFDRLSTATSRFIVLEIRRDHVLQDTFNSIWRREERELMRPLKIRLGEEGGEEGLDSGGVQQEFFRLAIAEALNPDYGTFTIDSRTKMTWFQPGSAEPLWKFELIGMIISLAVYNGLTLPVTFPKALYRKLLDEDVTELHHIADGWPDLANGLTTLLEWDEKDGLVEDIFARTYEFSVEQFGKPVSREMGTEASWPQFCDLNEASASNPTDAPLVTNENRNNYVSDYIKWLTDISIQPQFEAFKTGFFNCIDHRSISLFDPSTLQSVVEGIQEIDIPELRRATRYIGWDASHRTVRDFWSIVKKYDIDQKKKLLEFVTASDRVPVGGMRNLQFTLQRNGVDDGHLPSSYTCYGILLLPEYSSKDVLRQKMAMALENSTGFGFA